LVRRPVAQPFVARADRTRRIGLLINLRSDDPEGQNRLGPERRFPPPWSVEELAAMSDTRPVTPEQAATLKQLAKVAYELDAFKPNLTCAEADIRIAMLKAKLKLLDGPPHTL
jgi:hypothetical protein